MEPNGSPQAGVTPGYASPTRVLRVSFAVAALVAAAWIGWYLITPREVPLPPGAIALKLQTQPRSLLSFNLGCPLALLGPIAVGEDGVVMFFTTVAPGHPIKVSWPYAWSARLIGGRAELIRPDGTVFARDGDVIQNRLTGGAADDGTFVICSTDEVPNNPVIPSAKPPDPV